VKTTIPVGNSHCTRMMTIVGALDVGGDLGWCGHSGIELGGLLHRGDPVVPLPGRGERVDVHLAVPVVGRGEARANVSSAGYDIRFNMGCSTEPVHKGIAICLTTDYAAAKARGDRWRMVLVEVVGIDNDGAVTVQLTAWDIPG
jgi:hypothetical protein